MKMNLRFCSTFAVVLSLICAARAQQNPPAAPVPDAPAPAAPAAAPTTVPVETSAPATNAVAKPAAKKKAAAKTTKKKAAKPAAKKTAGNGANSGSQTNKAITRVEVNPPQTGTVLQDAVNVRGRPSFLGEVITKLKKGENVTVLEEITLAKTKKNEPAKWLKISLPTNTPVWVFAEYIDANKTVVPNKLNLRAGPGENFSPIGTMKKGDVIKDLRKVNEWIEIEAPSTAFAYVSAEFIDRKGAAPELAVQPAPPAEPVKPVESTVPPAEPAPKPPVETAEAPKPAEPAPAPAPAPEPAPAPQEVSVKRIAKREGTLKKAINIQAPTDYRLEGLDGKETINYVTSPEEQKMDEKTKKMVTVPKIDLRPYVGKKVIITGEEALDRRWELTPILTVESIELEQ